MASLRIVPLHNQTPLLDDVMFSHYNEAYTDHWSNITSSSRRHRVACTPQKVHEVWTCGFEVCERRDI